MVPLVGIRCVLDEVSWKWAGYNTARPRLDAARAVENARDRQTARAAANVFLRQVLPKTCAGGFSCWGPNTTGQSSTVCTTPLRDITGSMCCIRRRHEESGSSTWAASDKVITRSPSRNSASRSIVHRHMYST
nr:hypothetical protein CFP56_28614 [Quercus suber]